MVDGCGDKVLPESQPTHNCPEMDTNENSGYWFHTRPLLLGIKEAVLIKLLACSLTPMKEASSSCPRTINPSLGHNYLLSEARIITSIVK